VKKQSEWNGFKASRSFPTKVSSKCLLMFSIAMFLLGFLGVCVVDSNACGVSSPTNDRVLAGGQPELVVLIATFLLGLCCGCAVGSNSCGTSSRTHDGSGKLFAGGKPELVVG
jgi:hypothetical protein